MQAPSKPCLPSALSGCMQGAVRVRLGDTPAYTDGLGTAARGVGSWRPACRMESTLPATYSLKVCWQRFKINPLNDITIHFVYLECLRIEKQGWSLAENRKTRCYLRRLIRVHYQYFTKIYIKKLFSSIWKWSSFPKAKCHIPILKFQILCTLIPHSCLRNSLFLSISADFETLNNWTTFQSTVTVSFWSLPMTTPNAFCNPLKGLSQQ